VPPPDFVAPTYDEAFNDQGFQFALKEGRDALEKSAAAKGTLLTTGTLKDLDTFSQGAASQQYDKVYGRRARGIRIESTATRKPITTAITLKQLGTSGCVTISTTKPRIAPTAKLGGPREPRTRTR
jgi:hypothetical protein